MFLEQTIIQNPKLIKWCFESHQNGILLPDTYVVDLDQLLKNAKKMLAKAKEYNIELYFMLKQLGRNPLIAKKLIEVGYEGAVVVDYREAKTMMESCIPISNVGHLVQIPKAMIEEVVTYGCKYFTVFSVEKAKEINNVACKAGVVQKILLKVSDLEDTVYSGTASGFSLQALSEAVKKIGKMEHIQIAGVTSFPCFLYDEMENTIKPTNNLQTLLKAKEILESFGIEVQNVNAPSTTSVFTLEQMKEYPIRSGEPGHGLTGTTPLHAHRKCEEKPCVVYVSEISHHFDGNSYCYGGGYYRRSNVSQALIGKNMNEAKKVKVIPPGNENIDYYFRIDSLGEMNDTVIMAFRYQIFVTRSRVVVIKGIQDNSPELLGVFTNLGGEIIE